MNLLTNPSTLELWKDIIKTAEDKCSVQLDDELEAYLTLLLARYTNRPEMVKQLLADAFLRALQQRARERDYSLQAVGDQCLIFAGLFPRAAVRKNVNISYFVEIGRSAYQAVSRSTNDLCNSLAMQFVVLMDVLQSINPHAELLPIEAYDQWNEVGSDRALRILQAYTQGTPIKSINH